MKSFMHLKIGARLGSAFGGLILLMVILSVVAAFQAGRLQADSSFFKTDVVPSLGMVHTLVTETGRLRSLEAQHILMTDANTQKPVDDAITQSRALVNTQLKSYEALLRDDTDKQLYQRADEGFNEFLNRVTRGSSYSQTNRQSYYALFTNKSHES